MTSAIALPLLGAKWEDYISGMFILLLIVGSAIASKISEYLKKRREEESRRARAEGREPAKRAATPEQSTQTTKKALREIFEEVLGVPSTGDSEDIAPPPTAPPSAPHPEPMRKAVAQVAEAVRVAPPILPALAGPSQPRMRRTILADDARFSDLQRAIIFAEILGEPVALRESGELRARNG